MLFGKKFLARLERAESNLTDTIRETVTGISGLLNEISRAQQKQGEQTAQALELIQNIKETQAAQTPDTLMRQDQAEPETQAAQISNASTQQDQIEPDSQATQILNTSARQDQTVSGAVQDLRKAVTRHDDAIEDMLEEWEELRDDTRKSLAAVSKELHAGYDARIRTLEEKENELLSLCDAYQKHLLAMQRMAQDDPGWKKQLELIQEGLRPAEIRAGIQVTGQAVEKADLSIHEIVDIAQTQDPDMDGKVREVYENGCIYMGKPRKKARVSVWRCGTGI